MVVLKLRSPLAGVALAVLVVAAAGLASLRVDTAWTVEQGTAVSGSWGTGPGEFGRGAGVDGRPKGPQAVAVDGLGNVVVADSLNYRVMVFSPGGQLLKVIGLSVEAAPPGTGENRAAAYGLLEPCLGWGSGFRPNPDLAAPARPWVEPAASSGDGTGLPYVTDLALAPGAWRVDRGSGRLDPASGPDIFLLAGWEGVVLATDVGGTLKWSRDLAGVGTLFGGGSEPPVPEGPNPAPDSQTGYLLDLHALPRGGVLATGYVLLPERLIYFVRCLHEVEGEPVDLAAYELGRDGLTRVAEDLPIALEVESVAVGADGLLYVVAAAPEPAPSQGALPDASGQAGDTRETGKEATVSGAVSGAAPFARDVWIYTLSGQPKGKLALDCETYTRYLQLIGVDKRGLLYTRLSRSGSPGQVTVFDGRGRPAASVTLPEGAEVADAYLAPSGQLYLSVATDEGYQVQTYRVSGHRRLTWRWSRH